MVKFGNNRGGNRSLVRGGGNRQQGGFKRGGGNFRRRDAPEEGQPQRNAFDGQRRGGARRGGRFGGPRRGGPRREGGGGKGNRDHTSLDEDMLQYWDKAGVKDKREEAKVLEKAKLDRELEEYKLSVAAGAAATEQKA